jgi:hypothetical protein
MMLHDINDVLMELAKICDYSKLDLLAHGIFILFFISWIALRMVTFPAVILQSTLFEVVDVLGFRPPFWAVINCGFMLLYCIHVYWFCLILRVVWRIIRTGKGADVREEE